MEGIIKKLVDNKGYGFIKDMEGIEYFFHKDDFIGHWIDLVEDYNLGVEGYIKVTFEKISSKKGPRGSNVRRTEFPNEAV